MDWIDVNYYYNWYYGIEDNKPVIEKEIIPVIDDKPDDPLVKELNERFKKDNFGLNKVD